MNVLDESTRRRVTRMAYRAQQTGVRIPSLALSVILRLSLSRHARPPTAEQVRRFRARYDALLEQDLANVDAGLYPERLLFQMPWRTYARSFPRWLGGLPANIARARLRQFKELPRDIPLERYPAYFRRTFHWQRDGYFSRRSAEIYDVGVEVLFGGAADVMRRQIIPPLTRHLRSLDASNQPVRLLDVGCGTGRALAQLSLAHPSVRYTGLDLSPYYLKEAQRQLAEVADVSFVADNAEAMPFRDASFDAVTSVFMFHELPRKARRQVYAEMQRVLKPGGLLVIEDSAQLSEAADLSYFLETFPDSFHEPYYAEYLDDPIEVALSEAGFQIEAVERAFAAKVVTARRAPGAPTAAEG